MQPHAFLSLTYCEVVTVEMVCQEEMVWMVRQDHKENRDHLDLKDLQVGLDRLCFIFYLLCYSSILKHFTYYAYSEVHYAFSPHRLCSSIEDQTL